MSLLVEEGSVYGCRRFILLTVAVVIICLLLDHPYVKRRVASILPWWKECRAQIKRYVAGKCCSIAARLCEDMDSLDKEQILTPIASRPASPHIVAGSPILSPPSSPLSSTIALSSLRDCSDMKLVKPRLTKRSDSAVSINGGGGIAEEYFSAPPPTAAARVMPKHTLYVCTKCTRKTDDKDLGSCRLATEGGGGVADMEDLIPPPKPKTGQLLYQAVVQRNENADLVIQPVHCLSACGRGNVVAMAGGGKYTYQFGDVDERDEQQVGELLQFCGQWMESRDGFSKAKTRPRRMRSNCLARVPPLPVVYDNSKVEEDGKF